ncbi:MAG: hypothetical protein HY367_03825, partial [Candidatus Aenigmarchaeota archaeon]|nr:hypothetical protein [Candidatus Aenigmarchaeota archaeon]
MIMMLFGRKQRQEIVSTPRVPTEEVAGLSQQGYSEPEIIDALRREGYRPQEVDAAMREALRTSVRDIGANYVPTPRPVQERWTPPRQLPQAGRPPGGEFGGPPREFQPARPRRPPLGFEEEDMEEPEEPLPQRQVDDEMRLPEFFERKQQPMQRLESPARARHEEVEEVAESVVEDRFSQVRDRLNDMGARINQVSKRLADLEQRISTSQAGKPADFERIEKKVGQYEDSMEGLSSKMESLERVMKDNLTPMMQSMRTLSDTLKAMKAA